MFAEAMPREGEVRALEHRVASLSAQIHALMSDLVEAVAEVDETDAWHGWGTRSLAHWLSITGAWTMTDAHRLSRVATNTERLGEIFEMAQRGEIALPVLDAVARVITPENAESIQNIVATCTASQSLRVLSKYRELSQQPAPDAGGNPSPEQEPDLWWRRWNDEQGRGRVDAALSPLVAELLDEAYAAAARAGVDADADPDEPSAAADGTAPTPDGTPDSPSDSDSASGHRSPRWYPPSNGPDADRAVRRLAEWILDRARADGVRRTGGEPFAVLVTVDLETLLEALGLDPNGGAFGADGPFKLGSQCFTRSGRRLTNQELAEALASSTLQTVVTAEGVPLWMGNEVRFANRHERRALELRGNHACEIPGCTNTVGLDAHHVRYHGPANGPTSLDNLLHLCGPHHRQLHAEGWIVTSVPGSQRFTIHTSDGRCLGSTWSGGPPPDLAVREPIEPDAPPPPPRLVSRDAPRKWGGGAPLTAYALDVFLAGLLAA